MIDSKIEAYSSRITKIKSDYELFTDSMRKEMSGVTKFKSSFSDKLSEMGGLLASFGEMLLANGALLVQSYLESGKLDTKDGITYVTENDGIVYEWKPNISNKNVMLYRKQRL